MDLFTNQHFIINQGQYAISKNREPKVFLQKWHKKFAFGFSIMYLCNR